MYYVDVTYAPQALLDVRAYLRPLTGLSDAQLGIVGDENHDGGYHHGWDERRISNGVTSDYSWNESSRDSSHKTNAARALDVGMFPQLRDMSVWIVEQCKAGAPDTLDMREVIYSPDGKVVLRWDRLGIRTSGDPSHLTHTHFDWFADAEHRPKTGPFQRFFEEYAVALTQRELAIISNAYQVLYEWVHEHDPVEWVTDLETGKFTTFANLPLQRARRMDQTLEEINEKISALGTGTGISEDRLREIIREEIAKTRLS